MKDKGVWPLRVRLHGTDFSFFFFREKDRKKVTH